MQFKKSVLLAGLLLSALPSVSKTSFTKVEAASPMPTNINITIDADSSVSNYYQGVSGKKGDELLDFLYFKIKDHNEYDYDSNSHRNIFKVIDRNWKIDPLTPSDASNFNYVNDNPVMRKLYADYNDEIDTADRFYKPGTTNVTFDKEHIWAQSLGGFGRKVGAGSDLHALWPSDVKANQSAHSNYSYGIPTDDIREYNGDKDGYIGRNGDIEGSSNKVFEPLDEYKGDIARAMFYMPARYREYVDVFHPKLELVNYAPDAILATASLTGKAGILETLLEWNELDPVDEHEIRRNNLIAKNYQGNRNPFIDYPQWARIAYDNNYTGGGATNALETSSVGSNSDPIGDAALVSITLKETNAKKQFFVGDAFLTTGLVVSATYDNGITRPVADYDTSIQIGSILNTSGDLSVEVTYTHKEITKSASYQISVIEPELDKYLFISEVYGGGGNNGAYYNHDFIEIYNNINFPIHLDGMSLQYAPATSASWNVIPLSGVINPKSYLLAQLRSQNDTIGQVLPIGDFSASLNAAAGNFKIALVNKKTVFDSTNPTSDPDLIDFVGAGTANASLGSPAPAPNATESLQRAFITNGTSAPLVKDNSNDFTLATPTPTNAAITIALHIMEGDTPLQCIELYEPFKSRILALSEEQRSYFEIGTDTRLMTGRMRYEAWARYHGDPTPYMENSSYLVLNPPINKRTNNYLFFTVTASFIFASIVLILKKKQI